MLVHATRRHTGVHSLYDDRDAFRLQHLVDEVCNLNRHSLLNLEPSRKAVDHADELGEADDLPGRQVADVDDPGDRRHVMLAAGPEGNAPQQDRLVVAAGFLKSAHQVLGRIFPVSGKPFVAGPQDTRRGV